MAKVIRFNKRHLRGMTLPFLVWALVALAITACTVPLPQPDSASRSAAHQLSSLEPDPVPSPMFPSLLSTPVSTPPRDPLWRNTWRITEVVYWDNEVPLDDLGAFTVAFNENGTLAIYTETCGVVAYGFSPRFSDKHQGTFKLHSGKATKQALNMPACSRFQQVLSVFADTGAFEIQDDQLVLKGYDGRVVLEVEERRNPLKTLPNAALVEALWRHSWQIQEIVHEGQEVAFDTLGTVTITFDVDGYLRIFTENCNRAGSSIVPAGEQQYFLVGGLATARGCGELLDTQFYQMTTAVESTRAYEFQGNQLILLGDDMRIVLVPWSQAQ